MILSAENAVNQYQFVLKIMGLDPTTFMVIIFIVFIMGVIMWYFMNQQRQHKKNMDMVKNNAYCYFKDNGIGRFELCEINNGRIKRKIKTKDKEDIEDYYALPEHSDIIDYPIGKPKLQQVQIPLYHFYINNPVPQFPNDPKKWSPDFQIKMTSAMANITADEAGMAIVAEEQKAAFSDIKDIYKYLKKIPMQTYLLYAVLLLLAFNLALTWGQGGDMAAVKRFLTGK